MSSNNNITAIRQTIARLEQAIDYAEWRNSYTLADRLREQLAAAREQLAGAR